MASQTLSGGLWPNGTTVGVYPAVAVPAGSDVPSGQALTTGVVSGGSVTFSGLAERVRYYAYGGGKGVRFLIPATSTEGDRARIADLESRIDVIDAGGAGAPTGPAGGVLGGTYPNPGFAADMATQAELDAVASAAAGGVLAGTYPNPSFAVDMATQAELNAAIAGVSTSTPPRVALVVASFYATAAEKAGADVTCDGVDDQVEINAAIDAIKAATPGAGVAGGQVRLVGPRFNTSNSIVLKSYIWLEGDGWFMTEIKSQSTWNGAASSGIISLDNTGGTTATEYTTLRNLTVNPNKFVQTTVAVRGLSYVVDATTGWTYNDSTQTVEYVRVIDSSDDGIRLSGSNQRGCYFNNIRIERCALYGFRTDCADSHFHNMNIGGSGLAGVFVNGATNHRFTNCKVWFSGGTNATTATTALATQSAGYRVEGPRNSFVACEAQDNRGHGFAIGSDHNTFAGCVADSNSWATANANVGNADGFYIANDVHFVTLQGIAFDKNETNRGIAQRNGVRISTSTPLASNLIVDVAVDACQGGPYSGQASGYPQSRINVTGRGFGGRGSITTTSGSPTVTVNSTAQGAFANGDLIRSSLLPGGTSGGSAKITAGGGTATLTLDQNATSSGTGTAVSGPVSARGVRAGAALTSTPGAVTTLAIPHGLGVAPVIYDARPGDANARGAPAYHVTADATNVTLNFALALTGATPYTWIWDAVA